jgi:HK97 family phage portal protein
VLGKLAGMLAPNRAEVRNEPVVRLEVPKRARIPEKRSIPDGFEPKRGILSSILVAPSSSGMPINENSAMNVSAVTACVSLIADMVAKLPLYLYRKTANGPEEIKDHPAIQLMSGFPSDLHTSFELRQLMETGKGLGGNGYARVFRDSGFDPVAIEWLAPIDVEPQMVRMSNGQHFVAYQVNGEKNLLNRTDILHIRGISRDGIKGLSPISLLRESIGTALSQTQAAGTLMKNGARFPGFLVSQSVLPKDSIDDARSEWESKYAGSANAGRMPILNGTFDFKQTNGMSMADAQFIESRRFELQEIARIYRIPAFMIGDSNASNWGTGIEQQTLGFMNFCLDPHLRSWEESLAMTLLTTEEHRAGYYFQYDRDEVASVALEARANFYKAMREMRVFSANEVRSELGYQMVDDPSMSSYDNPAIAPQTEIQPA